MVHSRRIPGRGCCSRGLTLAFAAYPGRDCCSRGQTTTLHRALFRALGGRSRALSARRGPERPVAGRAETYKKKQVQHYGVDAEWPRLPGGIIKMSGIILF